MAAQTSQDLCVCVHLPSVYNVTPSEGNDQHSHVDGPADCDMERPLLLDSEDQPATSLYFGSLRFPRIISHIPHKCTFMKTVLTAVTMGKPKSASFNTAVGEEPFCCIYHEGEAIDKQSIAPCQCLVPVSYRHHHCIQQWKESTNQFHFTTKIPPFSKWLCHPQQQRDRCSLLTDLVCVVLISAMVTASAWLCLSGAGHLLTTDEAEMAESCWLTALEGIGLIILATLLICIYLFWLMICIRYYFIAWQAWSRKNQLMMWQPSNKSAT